MYYLLEVFSLFILVFFRLQTQNLASIQPRTSLLKLARSPCTDPPGGSWEEVRVLPMWWINKTVDMFFLFDMGLQFFLKAKVRQPDGSMKTLRTHKEIARNYFRGWFMIDFVSIVPIDVILMVWNKPELSKLKSWRAAGQAERSC